MIPQALTHAINCFFEVVHPPDPSTLETPPVPWPTVGAQLFALRQRMLAPSTSPTIKRALMGELAVHTEHSLPVPRANTLKADSYCKLMQYVFEATTVDAADLAAWRKDYASEGLADDVLRAQIFAFRTSGVYRGFYGPPAAPPATTPTSRLPTTPSVLMDEDTIYDEATRYLRMLPGSKLIDCYGYVSGVNHHMLPTNRFADPPRRTPDVVYRHHGRGSPS